MSPFFSSYYNCVHEQDFHFARYLSWHIMPVSRTFMFNNADLRRKFSCSTSWCHLAARAVATVFADKGITVADGAIIDIRRNKEELFLQRTTHSWCLTKHGSILDVGAIGVIHFSPILLANKSNVKDPSYGFVNERYLQDDPVALGEIPAIVRSQKFCMAFEAYISVLQNARNQVDQEIAKNKKK